MIGIYHICTAHWAFETSEPSQQIPDSIVFTPIESVRNLEFLFGFNLPSSNKSLHLQSLTATIFVISGVCYNHCLPFCNISDPVEISLLQLSVYLNLPSCRTKGSWHVITSHRYLNLSILDLQCSTIRSACRSQEPPHHSKLFKILRTFFTY
jgi:hypothetical protein